MFKTQNLAGSLILISLITGCGGSSNDSGGGGSSAKVNCSHFATQGAAQEYFNTHNASNLDTDHDGIACEHLPQGRASASVPPPDVSSVIGQYTLLGNICGANSCSAQSVSLFIESESAVTLCFSQNLESPCDPDNNQTYPLLEQHGNVLLFDNGQIELGSIEDGHLKLTFNEAIFYGQNILMTETSLTGNYNNEGIHQNSDNSYSLTSYNGRTIRWDEQNHISISNP